MTRRVVAILGRDATAVFLRHLACGTEFKSEASMVEWMTTASLGAACFDASLCEVLHLVAASFAVTTWDQTMLTGELAPRVLTHLLGPAFFVFAAGLHDLTSMNKPVERAVA